MKNSKKQIKNRKHWIFHKYKWETYSRRPAFCSGFFQDYTREKRFQVGHCKCGAYKYREIVVDLFLEMDIAFDEYKMKVVKELENRGEIKKAIEVLKI